MIRNRYLDVAKIILNSISQTDKELKKDFSLRDYLARTAISRAYEGVFLDLFYHFTDDLKVSYKEMKKVAKEFYKNKGVKVPINKHTAVGAYLSIQYGEKLGLMYEKLRKARNEVDYYLDISIPLDNKSIKEYIKMAEIIISEVVSLWEL